MTVESGGTWERFAHGADIGVRGIGATREGAFEQRALALTSVITDVEAVRPGREVTVTCEAPADDLLFVDWLNALIYEMSTRRMLFGRFRVTVDGPRLRATAWGESVDRARHEPGGGSERRDLHRAPRRTLDDGRCRASSTRAKRL